MDAVSTSIVMRTGYVGANTLLGVALKKGPSTGRAEGSTLTVCAICTDSVGWSAIEELIDFFLLAAPTKMMHGR